MVPADSRRIPRAPRYSGYHYASTYFGYRTVTVSGRPFQVVLLICCHATSWSYNPFFAVTKKVWALPRSLATTWGIINLFSFPTGTKMFQFPALASWQNQDGISSRYRVVPFGNLRIKGHLHLPAAYRSLSRPSSPPRAKASAMRPCLLSSSLEHILRCVGWYILSALYFN